LLYDEDQGLIRFEYGRLTHVTMHIGVYAAGDYITAFRQSPYPASEFKRCLVNADAGKSPAVTQLKSDFLAHASSLHCRNCFGISDWTCQYSGQTLAKRFGQDIHDVAGASRHAIVSMIQHQYRTLP